MIRRWSSRERVDDRRPPAGHSADRQEALLRLVAPGRDDDMRPLEQLVDPQEVEAVLRDIAKPLAFVPFERHDLL